MTRLNQNGPMLYCPSCRTHTPHQHLVAMYATACTVCHTQTSQVERVHTEQYSYTAPDGTEAQVVHNTPDLVTFFVPTGEHKGYYHYEKGSGKREVVPL